MNITTEKFNQFIQKIPTIKKQQGGNLDNNEKQFIAFLIQQSGAQSQQELEDFVNSLGEDGLKAMYQKFIQSMSEGVQSARTGAKLNYIKSLRGICPEGYELEYYKKGGQICTKCIEKQEKQGALPFTPMQGSKGTKLVQDFKKDMKSKKKMIKSKKPCKKELGGLLINDDLLDMFKCGGKVKKTKKKQKGGLVQKKKGIPIKKQYIKQDQATKDSIAANKYNDQEVQTMRPGSYKKNKYGKVQWTPDRTKAPYNKK